MFINHWKILFIKCSEWIMSAMRRAVIMQNMKSQDLKLQLLQSYGETV